MEQATRYLNHPLLYKKKYRDVRILTRVPNRIFEIFKRSNRRQLPFRIFSRQKETKETKNRADSAGPCNDFLPTNRNFHGKRSFLRCFQLSRRIDESYRVAFLSTCLRLRSSPASPSNLSPTYATFLFAPLCFEFFASPNGKRSFSFRGNDETFS